MKLVVKIEKLAFLLLLALFFVACSNDNTARLKVRLTDAPGDFEEVNIDIQGVQVNAGTGNNGWTDLEIKTGVYNVLEFTNGIDTLLGTTELPAGKIQQIRLILGDENSVTVDGETHAMTTPSAQQSGLKLNLHATLQEGVTYTILLDFDAARSVVEKGNHTYSLKPVIRVVEEATSGAIKGMVTPIDATPAVYAIAGTDTVATSFADETGKFLLKGVEAGTYTISIVPKTGLTTVDKTNVTVTLGQVTDLGTIELN